MRNESGSIPGSFRDPSGFVFRREGVLFRQVNRVYQAQYDHLMNSGLYEKLASDGMLIPHTEAGSDHAITGEAYKVIAPAEIGFVSYPYEWCFSQLKHAALLSLDIQSKALGFGMSLKDCSAFNVQCHDGRPVFIDTLSFETYREGKPWIAYRQFCQHFLAPLALMRHVDVRLLQLLRVHLDGVPLDLASRLLPARTWLSFPLLSHIHLHARAQRHYADDAIPAQGREMRRVALLGLVDNLRSAVEKLDWQPEGTEWHDYYTSCGYSLEAMQHKQRIVAEMLGMITPAPRTAWDLGANTGLFSRMAADGGILTVSFDSDPAAVEENYLECRARGETRILPLVLDLANPSPSLGWESRERASLLRRGPADVLLALALVHHLVVTNNVPFARLAGFLSRMGSSLIIEFVPRDDPQVQRLLANREDSVTSYGEHAFEREFTRFFSVREKRTISGTSRALYLMVRRDA